MEFLNGSITHYLFYTSFLFSLELFYSNLCNRLRQLLFAMQLLKNYWIISSAKNLLYNYCLSFFIIFMSVFITFILSLVVISLAIGWANTSMQNFTISLILVFSSNYDIYSMFFVCDFCEDWDIFEFWEYLCMLCEYYFRFYVSLLIFRVSCSIKANMIYRYT